MSTCRQNETSAIILELCVLLTSCNYSQISLRHNNYLKPKGGGGEEGLRGRGNERERGERKTHHEGAGEVSSS